MSERSRSIISVIAVFLGMIFCVVIGFAIQNHSLAWFAKNERVAANGLEVSAKVTPNLVIADSVENITSPDILADESPFGVAFNKERTQMSPATHDAESESGSFLEYVTNVNDIDIITGYGKDGASLEWEEVALSEDSSYYFDCVVYIAAAGVSLEESALSATFFSEEDIDVAERPSLYAASIDFYLGEVSADGYKGTLSLAEAIEGNKIELFAGEIPLNTQDYLTVIMRFYFDGDLQNPNNGHAYVNSDTIIVGDTIKLEVLFEAL